MSVTSTLPFAPSGDAPLRGEILSGERLARLARSIAKAADWEAGGISTPLDAIVRQARTALKGFYDAMAADAHAQLSVPVAAEWVLDNYYLLDERFRTLGGEIPHGERATRLPRMAHGQMRGLPRIYECAGVLVTHTDARLDRETLVRFVMAFQEVSAFSIAELWLLPTALRVCLLDDLRRLAVRVRATHVAQLRADAWADRLLQAAGDGEAAVEGELHALARSGAPETLAFSTRLFQRLQGQDEALEPALRWLDGRLGSGHASPETLIAADQREQAADQVSVANAITSLRALDALAWREVFEECSLVEQALQLDPADVYSRMDERTRDRYRGAVEAIAARCPLDEVEVAEAAVSAALAALAEDPADTVRSHVGWHLIAEGRYGFERAVRYRPLPRERLHRGPLARPGLVYAALIALPAAALTALAFALARACGASGLGATAFALLAATPLSQLAFDLANRAVGALWPARVLPKLDTRRPVAAAHRTLVVVPALLGSAASAQRVLDRLEVAYLANGEAEVGFALLGDVRPGASEHAEGDDVIIAAARERVGELNARYAHSGAAGGAGPFFLFVRKRRYDRTEGRWMGWERKRGALLELCALLRGATGTSIAVREGDAAFLPRVSFIVTLDADTVLPREGARKLVAAIAHPLNRARLGRGERRVRAGYGLVQPRVSMSLDGSQRSAFAWLQSGATGVDPYASAASDVYQDVFGEGSFTGKGIIDVDVFNALLAGRFPDDTLLSHDLIEGSYVRTALASDIEVFDDQPASYLPFAARAHRWTRGDWQTLPWLGRTVPTPDGRERNPLGAIHRFKIADNLRRSLTAPTAVLAVFLGAALLPGSAWWLTAAVLAIALLPALIGAVDAVASRLRGAARADLGALGTDLGRDAAQALLGVATLAHQACSMADAIERSLWRMRVSRRHLLEWETAADAERRLGSGIAGFLRRFSLSLAVVLAGGALVAVRDAAALPGIAPLLAAWLLAPLIAWRVSRPALREPARLAEADVPAARRVARRTWRFFETFVTAEDHWLAPDNFQEEPKGEVAHRTSPTNMGLQLLSALTAFDLGYLDLAALVARTSRTLATMAGLERFRGHFYNWYDTRTLQPLRPTYVSTVDSGNLAGHLVALRVGLEQAAAAPLLGDALPAGLADTVRLAIAEVTLAELGDAGAEVRASLEELLRRLDLERAPAGLASWLAALEPLEAAAAVLPARLATLPDTPAAASARSAVDAVLAALRSGRDLIERCAPWAPLMRAPQASDPALAEALRPLAKGTPSLSTLAGGMPAVRAALEPLAADDGEAAVWAAGMLEGLAMGAAASTRLLAELRLCRDMAREMYAATDFRMLYDRARMAFSIGFNTAEGTLDGSFYDMLASECRLASYVAIAKGDVPQEHWFHLGRALTRTGGGAALVSWSASMFEYLMPCLVMRTWPGTLLDDTYRAVVARQRQYGRQRGVPWGVSEAAFAAKDAELTYQYQAFGVPGLGLKRGLSDDVVVAPYATVLALAVDPAASMENLRALARQGAEGRYGFYESIDYTPGRIETGRQRTVVRAYMAHHQGMSMVALGNALTGERMVARFHADPEMRSAEPLLQERVPRRAEYARPHVEEVAFVRSARETPQPVTRSYPTAQTYVPSTHFLSNGSYSVMVTNAGGGYSRWRDRTVTRYREDVTRDCWGTFIYLRDTATGKVWSAGFQPMLAEPDEYHVVFSADKAEFRRRDGRIETRTEVFVSPEDDVETRRVTVANHGRAPVTLEVTSYFEVTLAERGADHAHRAFSNLFVQTEVAAGLDALLFTRRPRSATEERVWGMHVLACEAAAVRPASFETDRAAFLGRLRGASRPQAVYDGGALGGSAGAVIDPVCAIRVPLTIAPGATARLAFSTGVAATRDAALSLAEQYHDIRSAQRTADLAWSRSAIELHDLGITPEEAVTFQRLASRLLLTDPCSRLKVIPAEESPLGVQGLWQLGISGDLPILLVRVKRLDETPLVRQALLAHQYWRSKGFAADLVVLDTQPSAYSSELDGRLRTLLRTGHALQLADKPGGVFLRHADEMPPEVLTLLVDTARAVLDGEGGPIALQLDRRARRPAPPDPLIPAEEPHADVAPPLPRPALAFDNGLGGFDEATGEYVLVLDLAHPTPAPWANVLAGPVFGALVSEAGVGCTWARNSHENRITTWNNDPVCDGSGELLYVRDERTGEFWSPTLLPVPDAAPCVVRHGAGVTRFERTTHGVAHTVEWFVGPSDPVRVVRVTLANHTARRRELSVTQLVEWSLGSSRSTAQQRVATWWDEASGTLMAHDRSNLDFPGLPAFLAADVAEVSFTASRTEFIGRNGTPADPAAMHRRHLGGQTGRFHDDCGALMRTVTLEPGEQAQVTFLLGQADDETAVRELVARYREPGAVDAALERTRAAWQRTLGAVQVRTPDAALDRLLNGPALYQTLACRFWGRTATYQSSGAFGFRDQLQDCLALLYTHPELVREHILEAARHQFPEGDVLHWWQPVSGRGVRTRFADDRHWLPFVVAEYVRSTGDAGVLDERLAYLEGPPVPEGREDAYLQPKPSSRTATLYEHCVAALELAPLGEHGLPLMGGGDWNDGMNRVGEGGRGESVWLAWFLDVTLRAFAPLAEARGDAERTAGYRARAAALVASIEREAWDGAWYRRAFFDDGTPLGTAAAEECRIDSIAQSWAAIAGTGDPQRARLALHSADELLVRWEDGLALLLAPPFDRMTHDPGYIRGYVPGVRENGGQYTHAAIWMALAHARLGDGEEALALLDLVNPIGHTLDAEAVARYRVEPYAIAADVYALTPHVGRGGWTWYTGSAGWFYRVAVGELLGLRLEARNGRHALVIDPCIPKSWPRFELTVRLGEASYHITVANPRGANRGVERVALDGRILDDGRVPLDGTGTHEVAVTMLGG